MRNKALLPVFLAAVIAAGSALYYTGPAAEDAYTAAAADDGNDDWLHAKGSRLFDKNGNEVWLTGANWFGMNCTENFPHGLWSADVDKLLSQVADRGINIIRFPISTELLLSWMNGSPYKCEGLNPKNEDAYKFNPDFCHEDGSEMNSMEVFDVIMQKCKKYGIKALVDVHSPASHNSGHNYELWYYEPTSKTADDMATVKEKGANQGDRISWQDWIDSLTWLAKKYANDDTIIAYDLKNEPHGKRGYDGTTCPTDIARWDDTELKNNWKYSAEQCANSILKVNPNALILVEGVEQFPKIEEGYTYDTPDIWNAPADKSPWYGAWWGGNLRGVRKYPVKPDSGTSQIVYSPHDYGPSVYAQTWFDKDFTTESLLDDYWYDTWAYINVEDIAPLLIGEWGGHMDAGKNQKWMELLRDFMIEHHINHTFWCLNPNSGDTGGLLDATFSTWDEKKYGLFEEALWQTTDGTYIGLDHKTPLGTNGMSLEQFYASGKNSNLDGGEGGYIKDDPKMPEDPPVAEVTTTAPQPVTTTTYKTTANDTPSGATLWGDADLNGIVDVSDAVLIARYVAEDDTAVITKQGKANAAVSGKGTIVLDDAAKILKFVAKLITKEELAPN
ncbi:MAG TPA: glycoside hydrolase [Ruminococcus sp.]|nr:glycoside hydrolase [Ruminococcus sp.]